LFSVSLTLSVIKKQFSILEILLIDENGFQLQKVETQIDSYTKIVGEAGKVHSFRYDGSHVLDQLTYREAAGISVKWSAPTQ